MACWLLGEGKFLHPGPSLYLRPLTRTRDRSSCTASSLPGPQAWSRCSPERLTWACGAWPSEPRCSQCLQCRRWCARHGPSWFPVGRRRGPHQGAQRVFTTNNQSALEFCNLDLTNGWGQFTLLWKSGLSHTLKAGSHPWPLPTGMPTPEISLWSLPNVLEGVAFKWRLLRIAALVNRVFHDNVLCVTRRWGSSSSEKERALC